MKKMIILATLLAFGTAQAETNSSAVYNDSTLDSGYSVALKMGTLGVGVEVSSMISENFGMRGNINYLGYNDVRDAGDLTYDTDINFLTVGILGDYYPFGGVFRLSGGAYLNNNNVDGNYAPTAGSTFELGNGYYSSSEIINVNTVIEWENSISPYLGMGWGNNSQGKGWGFSFDIGAMYQGSTIITTTPDINSNVPAPIRAQILADAQRETQTVQDDISEYKWYPVVSIGVTYSF